MVEICVGYAGHTSGALFRPGPAGSKGRQLLNLESAHLAQLCMAALIMVLQGRASSGWGSSSSLDSRFTRVRSIAYHFMHLSNNRVPEITLDYIPGLRGEKKTELSSQLFSAHGEFFILLLVLLPLRITRVFCFQYKKNIYFKSRDCVL